MSDAAVVVLERIATALEKSNEISADLLALNRQVSTSADEHRRATEEFQRRIADQQDAQTGACRQLARDADPVGAVDAVDPAGDDSRRLA